MNADERARLRALAEKATPGPWVTERDRPPPDRPEIATVAWVAEWCVGVPTPGYPGGDYRNIDYGENGADAKYLAALSPDVVLRLLDDVERLEAALFAIANTPTGHKAIARTALDEK